MDVEDIETRLDGFYNGRFHLVQPAKVGYRSGLDALLLAATISEDATGRLVDLGSGAGAVGFAAAVRAPGLAVTLVEKEPVMAECARAGLVCDCNGAFAGRLSVVEADLMDRKTTSNEARFDHVVTNPPFYAARHRSSPDPLRRAALTMPSEDFLADWFRASFRALKGGGRFSAILPPETLPLVLPAFRGRVGGPFVTPIHGRLSEPATRIVLSGRKGSREPLAFGPPRWLYDGDGDRGLSHFAIAVESGTAHFGWPGEGPKRR